MYLLRAKQLGFDLRELDELDEGMIMDAIIESGNDNYADEYQELATQADFDAF